MEFWDFINAVLNADTFTVAAAAVLALFACLLVQAMSGSRFISCLMLPVLFVGALVGVYGLRLSSIVILADPESNLIVTACIGMLCALFICLFAIRVVYRMADITRPIELAGRQRE